MSTIFLLYFSRKKKNYLNNSTPHVYTARQTCLALFFKRNVNHFIVHLIEPHSIVSNENRRVTLKVNGNKIYIEDQLISVLSIDLIEWATKDMSLPLLDNPTSSKAILNDLKKFSCL